MRSVVDVLLTLVLLPEDFGEIERALDSLAPELSLKSKLDLISTLCDGGELEEVASNHNLTIIVAGFSAVISEANLYPSKRVLGLPY